MNTTTTPLTIHDTPDRPILSAVPGEPGLYDFDVQALFKGNTEGAVYTLTTGQLYRLLNVLDGMDLAHKLLKEGNFH
jgi:hypothetical protein